MSKTQYDIPLTLVIPRPMPYEKAQDRGIESTSGPEGCHILYRGTTFERERIKLAAKACGLTYGMFIRILANNATEIILRIVKEQDKKREAEHLCSCGKPALPTANICRDCADECSAS